ncbi:hypothetical protein LRP88_04061 [Fusarium phalaenopsidis]
MNTETSVASAPTAPTSSDVAAFSDRQIAEALGYFGAEPFIEERYGRAARQIFTTTQQWPWELVTGFAPRRWDGIVIKKLAEAIDDMVKASAKVDRDVEIDNLIAFMRERARQREKGNPALSYFDIRAAKEHFSTKARDCAPRGNANTGGETHKRGDPTGFPSSVCTGKRKRTHESSDDSQTNKSVRRDGPGNPGGLALGSPANTVTPAEGLVDSIEPVKDEALTPSSMSDMIGTVENLKVESQTHLNESTRKLDKARSLMKQRETSLHKVPAPGELEELRRARDQKIDAKEAIEKAKALFEQHQGEMALDTLLISQASQQYDMKLRECEEGIAQAEAELCDMDMALTFTTQQGDKRQDKLEELEYYRTIERLMKLGPHGLASLAEGLAESGISLLTAAEDPEVKNEPSINPPS